MERKLQVYAPFGTLLNDVVFDKYHLFHPTARMLSGFRPAPQRQMNESTFLISNRSSDYAKPIFWKRSSRYRGYR
jgi:hypothetical protein